MTCRLVYALCVVLAAAPLAAATKSGIVKDWTFTNYGDGTAGSGDHERVRLEFGCLLRIEG